MRLFRDKRLLLILGIILVIVLVFGSIFILNTKEKQQVTKISYIGYDNLLDKIKIVTTKNPALEKSTDYTRIFNNLNKAQDPTLSPQKRLKILLQTFGPLTSLYISSRDPNLYKLQVDLNDFIVLNFPKEKEYNFKPLCYDPSCAEPMSTEISGVIDQIKSSTLPQYLKDNDIENLTNGSYLTKDTLNSKVHTLLVSAIMIRSNTEYIALNINNKIADEIENYVKNNFPEEYKIQKADLNNAPRKLNNEQ